MKHFTKKNCTLYLLLLCIILAASTLWATKVFKQSHTAFADTQHHASIASVANVYGNNYNEISVTEIETTVYLQKEGGRGGKSSVTAILGEQMPAATPPTKEGYIFGGYFSDPNGQGTQYYYANMSSAHIWDIEGDECDLYAYWETPKYTVYFNKHGGEGGSDSVTVGYGETLPSNKEDNPLTAPTKRGYTFEGYYTQEKGQGEMYYNRNMISTSEIWDYEIDGILHAYWIPFEYKIYLDNGEGSGESEIDNQSYGEPMKENVMAPVRYGYVFDGYYSEPEGQGTKYYNADMKSAHIWDIDKDTTLFAYYTPIEITVTLSFGGATMEIDGKTYTNTYKFTAVYDKPENLEKYSPNKTGFAFENWTLNDEEINVVDKFIKDITLKATWYKRIASADIYTLDRNLQDLNLSGYTSIVLILPASNFDNPCHLTIPASVRKIHIFAETYNQYDLYITVNSRSTDLDLYLENFAMCAPVQYKNGTYSGLVGITMTTNNNSALNLYTYGKVEIKGATPPYNPNGKGYDGSYAIKCSTLKILAAEDLCIYGGDGSQGYTGQGYGAYAVYVEYPIYCPRNHVTILGGYSGLHDSMAMRYPSGIFIIYLDD